MTRWEKVGRGLEIATVFMALVTSASGIYYARQAQRTAVASIQLATKALEDQHRHAELSIAPRLFEDMVISDDTLRVGITNEGLGPAKIGIVKVRWAGGLLFSNQPDSLVAWNRGGIEAWAAAIGLPKIEEILFGPDGTGLYVPPGGQLAFFQIRFSQRVSQALHSRVRTSLARCVQYFNLYNRRFVSRAHTGPDRCGPGFELPESSDY